MLGWGEVMLYRDGAGSRVESRRERAKRSEICVPESMERDDGERDGEKIRAESQSEWEKARKVEAEARPAGYGRC